MSTNENIVSLENSNEGFDKCPFCGDYPEVTNLGTFLDIECCASMSFQKSDVLGGDVWRSNNMIEGTHMYEYKIEKIIHDHCKAIWNRRV